MAKKAAPSGASPPAGKTSKAATQPKRTKTSAKNLTTAFVGELKAVVNIGLDFEYAVVPEREWDNPAADMVSVGSRQATEADLKALPCYEFSSAQRHRHWLTEIGRRDVPECRSGIQNRFVLVKLVSFKGIPS